MDNAVQSWHFRTATKQTSGWATETDLRQPPDLYWSLLVEKIWPQSHWKVSR